MVLKKISITRKDNYNKIIGAIKVCAPVHGTSKSTGHFGEKIK